MTFIRGILKLHQFCYLYKNVIIGKNVKIFPGAVIGRPSNIRDKELILEIGDNCTIGACSVIYTGSKIGKNTKILDGVCIKERVNIGNNTIISNNTIIDSDSFIGNDVQIMDHCYITSKCIIENNVFIGMMSSMASHNFEREYEQYSYQTGAHIMENVMIGQGSCILPNIVIGRNSKIGSNSLVTKSIPSYALAMGVPAKISKIGNVEEFKI
jgi:acetyltransferase-like isoleucine patch superfamily enzyme